jgi:hypothetical protein
MFSFPFTTSVPYVSSSFSSLLSPLSVFHSNFKQPLQSWTNIFVDDLYSLNPLNRLTQEEEEEGRKPLKKAYTPAAPLGGSVMRILQGNKKKRNGEAGRLGGWELDDGCV